MGHDEFRRHDRQQRRERGRDRDRDRDRDDCKPVKEEKPVNLKPEKIEVSGDYVTITICKDDLLEALGMGEPDPVVEEAPVVSIPEPEAPAPVEEAPAEDVATADLPVEEAPVEAPEADPKPEA